MTSHSVGDPVYLRRIGQPADPAVWQRLAEGTTEPDFQPMFGRNEAIVHQVQPDLAVAAGMPLVK